MTLDEAWVAAWRDATAAAAERALDGFAEGYGYPPDANSFAGPAPAEEIDELASIGGAAVPPDLLAFYRVVGEVCLPDIGNGYFLGRPRWVVRGVVDQEPLRVAGNYDADVVAFGTDGGGTMYALAAGTGSPVYRLPPADLREAVYRSDDSDFRVVAFDLAGFLTRLRQAVERFAHDGAISDL